MHRLFALGVLVGLGCRSADGRAGAPLSGTLDVRWKDSTGTARLSAPAEARWCARDSMLELVASRNDTAMGVALYARDSLRAEGYPVFQAGTFAPWRPQAAAGLRLLTPASLLGYESTWGRVVVTAISAAGISGTLDLHLKYVSGPDSLHLTGSFTGVAVQQARPPCGRANKPAPG